MDGERGAAAVEQRSFFRVRCRLPIRLRAVGADRLEGLEREILQRDEEPRAVDLDPYTARWLDRIESKLDQILLHLGVIDEPLRPSDVVELVISGSGLRVPWTEAHVPGAVVLAELELPGTPPHAVRCLASVVACDAQKDGGHGLALTFRTIHERDREAIVQHTLAVERGEIRSRAGGRDAS